MGSNGTGTLLLVLLARFFQTELQGRMSTLWDYRRGTTRFCPVPYPVQFVYK